MKRLSAILFCIVLTASVTYAQTAENGQQMRTIFGGPDVRSIGGYGALEAGYTNINKLDAVYFGARGAVVINHRLALGLGGKGFISHPVYDKYLLEDYEFAGGYGGFYIEPIFNGNSPVHISLPMLIGAGGVGYLRHWGDYDDNHAYHNVDEDSYAFFVFEPGIEVEFNLLNWMRMSVVGSYRLTSDIKLKYKERVLPTDFAGKPIASENMMRGFNVGLIMKFGKF